MSSTPAESSPSHTGKPPPKYTTTTTSTPARWLLRWPKRAPGYVSLGFPTHAKHEADCDRSGAQLRLLGQPQHASHGDNRTAIPRVIDLPETSSGRVHQSGPRRTRIGPGLTCEKLVQTRAPGAIRTHTGRVLNPLPLPVGLRGLAGDDFTGSVAAGSSGFSVRRGGVGGQAFVRERQKSCCCLTCPVPV